MGNWFWKVSPGKAYGSSPTTTEDSVIQHMNFSYYRNIVYVNAYCVCQCVDICLSFSKKKQTNPGVGIVPPILGMRKLRHRDVNYLCKVTYFVNSRARLRI